MKKIMLCLLAISASSIFAQEKLTEGVIVAKQFMVSDNEAIKPQLSLMDISTTMYFKGGKSRTEYYSKYVSGETITIVDQTKGEMLFLANNTKTGKVYDKATIQFPTKEELENITVIKADETKTILGYKCQRYDVIVTKGEETFKSIMYITNEIEIPQQEITMYKDELKNGVALYIEAETGTKDMQMRMIIEAVEIRKETVDDLKFDMTIPEGYTENNIMFSKN